MKKIKSSPTDLHLLVEQYLQTDRIDRHVLIGSKISKIKEAFDNKLYAKFSSLKKLINYYKPYCFGYAQSVKYLRVANDPVLSRKRSQEINSVDLNKLCKVLPMLRDLEKSN